MKCRCLFSKLLKLVGNKSTYLRFHLLIFTFLITTIGFSQEVNVKTSSDTNAIKIGQQVSLFLEVNHSDGVVINWPAVPDTFATMEVLERFSVDTLSKSQDGNIVLRQKFILTSFDSGYHVVPPFVFSYMLQGDTSLQTAESNPLLITVNTIPVDFEKEIKDIKGQVGVPFTWRDALPYILGLAALFLIIYLVRLYLKNRKKKPLLPIKQIPQRPAHEIALEALKKLDDDKLWQNGNHKGYHTQISDIIRTFIENRWAVNAMEMTTDEILSLQIISNQPGEVLSELKYLLELSDLVKFAKMIPVVYENEQCIRNAVNFVNANRTVQDVKEGVA